MAERAGCAAAALRVPVLLRGRGLGDPLGSAGGAAARANPPPHPAAAGARPAGSRRGKSGPLSAPSRRTSGQCPASRAATGSWRIRASGQRGVQALCTWSRRGAQKSQKITSHVTRRELRPPHPRGGWRRPEITCHEKADGGCQPGKGDTRETVKARGRSGRKNRGPPAKEEACRRGRRPASCRAPGQAGPGQAGEDARGSPRWSRDRYRAAGAAAPLGSHRSLYYDKVQ